MTAAHWTATFVTGLATALIFTDLLLQLAFGYDPDHDR